MGHLISNLKFNISTPLPPLLISDKSLTLTNYESESQTIHSTTTKGDGSTTPERHGNKSNKMRVEINLKVDTLKDEIDDMAFTLFYVSFR